MRRQRLAVIALIALVALAAVAGGCGGKATPTSTGSGGGSQAPVTITVWHPWTVKSEKQGFATAVAGFEKQYPWITLNIVTFPNSDDFDQTLIKNINAGTPPDVAISFGPDYVGKYASGDLWMDLKPFMDKENFSMDQFAPAAVSYTSYGGKQVALPVLTDAYGLYYNKDLFAKAGLTEPPKTMSQLLDYAQKLTVRDKDGTIQIAGFVPLLDFNEIGPSDLAMAWGGTYFDANSQPHLATDPAWASALQWQKELVDWYGVSNIQRFYATWVDKEWTPDQVFESGKAAMVWDGEWRTKMIENDGNKVNYATAPFPAADERPELYGQGRVGGTITGIPRGAKNPEAAWLLVKYMSTNTDFLVSLANMLGNVPTTKDSAASPNLQVPVQMQTFIDVWNNPNSHFSPPLTSTGSTYADYMNTFDEKWVKGGVSDLAGGLAQVDEQIANELAQGAAP